MDLRRLTAFVKVVDVGSVTRAASLLQVAQPGLSQQILGLEHELKTRLLDRSPKGVTPTEAGMILYRHAQVILRQFEDARLNVREADQNLKGHVRVGLTAWSSASLLAPRLVSEVRRSHPGILLEVCDTFPVPFSEMVLKGRLDMAWIYGDRAVRGLSYLPCGRESFELVLPPALAPDSEAPVPPGVLADMPLVLPPETSFQRQMVERACGAAGRRANVVAEVYTLEVLGSLLAAGEGGAVLPPGIARPLADRAGLVLRRSEAELSMSLSLCTPETDAMSAAALAVHGILLALIADGAGAPG